MTRRLVSGLLAGAVVAVAGAAAAQYGEFRADTRGYVPGQAPCSMGYWCNSYPTPTTGIIWRSGTYNGSKGLAGNLCWRAGYWTPAMAIKECEPELVKVEAAPPAPPPAAPTPPPPAPGAPPPPPPGVQKITLAAKALFDFDKAVLKPEGKEAIDREIISRLRDITRLELVLVTGHTDRIGTQAYNQRLSERRANAVRDYLVSKGVPRDKIETLGMGKTQPVPGVVCNQRNMKELIACLAPNRRVEVEVKGDMTVRK